MSYPRDTRPLKGRGAVTNPAGRFESQSVESVDDGWHQEAWPESVATSITAERARSIITTNDSPDVGFDYSINPYRGCEHGCIYCLAGDTEVLLTDGRTAPLAELAVGQRIVGTAQRGRHRHFVETTVLAHWRTRKPAYRVRLAGGTQLTASGEHRFLTTRGWRSAQATALAPALEQGDELVGPSNAVRHEWPDHVSWARSIGRSASRAALAPVGVMEHTDPARALHYIQWRAGRERPSCGPTTSQTSLFDAPTLAAPAGLRVAEIQPLGAELELFDITTGTGDFIANGVVSHNCYARPAHSYVGLSPGLDFETKLFYKADAAALLERELASPRYVCKPIMIGANTDPYQPVERRLCITRSILEVLARCRHPVSLITKGALIARDIDLLADLARDGLVSVAVSLTSLEPTIKRTLEPRTAAPEARLRVMRQLSDAGIPVRVMVAPVIPAITDHELERLLEAARDAGARSATYVVLRLPYEVKTLFRDWLAEHYPDRAAHVMALVNDLRGGRDNDPRFGLRMRGTGPFAELLRSRFQLACRRLGLNAARERELDTHLFRPPVTGQLSLGI